MRKQGRLNCWLTGISGARMVVVRFPSELGTGVSQYCLFVPLINYLNYHFHKSLSLSLSSLLLLKRTWVFFPLKGGGGTQKNYPLTTSSIPFSSNDNFIILHLFLHKLIHLPVPTQIPADVNVLCKAYLIRKTFFLLMC